jgi:hypothetical protein
MPRSVPHGCPRHCLLAADLVDQVRRRRVGTTGPQFLPDVAHSMGEVEDFRLGRAVMDMSFHACHSRASSNASPRDSIRRIGRGRSSLTIARRRSDPSPRGARRARPRRDQSPQAASWPYKIPMGRVSVFKSGWGRPAYSWGPTCPPSEVIQPRKCLGRAMNTRTANRISGVLGMLASLWAIVGTLASNRVRSSSSAGSDCAALGGSSRMSGDGPPTPTTCSTRPHGSLRSGSADEGMGN